MAENKMLIDATHPEETRVVVLREGRVEEFDYESAARKLLRGSIFLAKITRVEPSLQAAFVDYGGNRHGFLAFNEIHPDYYQIPHSDRQALLEAEMASRRYDDDDDIDLDDEPEVVEAVGEDDDTPEDAGADDADRQDRADVGEDDTQATAAEADDDEPDFEETAIDVTALLPAEAEAEQQPADLQTASVSDDQVGNVGEAEPQDDDEADDSAETADGDAAPPKKPRTIAAATPPDERIVGEIIEPGPEQEDGEPSSADGPVERTPIVSIEPEVALASDTQDMDAPDQETTSGAAGSTAAPADESTISSNDSEVDDGVIAREDSRDNPGDVAPGDEADDVSDRSDGEVDQQIDEVRGDADVSGEVPVRRRRRARHYKIQEVIKRRQVVLVQVVKEERGNKGAALTSYLSLAGRYTVLMPNTARGGGISRKITNLQDRKRLKAIAQELDVPEGMGLIIRTAGASRTKQEIKRDYEYLLRLWENVRDLTLQSTAPSLVYEEGDLIKRSIRDLYSKDIEQVVVAGENAHKEAKGFMRMLMPSHAKNVIKYEDPQPLFARYRIEQQLNAMFSPFVQLRSGGYLVINQTEALVAVDVNSGKSTRKFSIEDTALNTNLEASEELSRQLKLRDLAGLIVIDFIDMEEKRNNRAVERRLKECLRNDRARIQVGRISHFGLLEMSRQRLRTGVLEGSTMPCHHCQGTGIIRSTESVALAVLRGLEDSLMGHSPRSLTAHCSRDVAMYLLNHKRSFVLELEMRYGIDVHINASDEHQGAEFLIERMGGGGQNLPRRIERSAINVESGFSEAEETTEEPKETARDDGERRPRRRRRRRGRRSDGESSDAETLEANDNTSEEADDANTDEVEVEAREDGEERGGRRRRRGRRGGRRNRNERSADDEISTPGAPQPEVDGESGPADAGSDPDAQPNAEPVEIAEPTAVTQDAASDPQTPEAAEIEPTIADPSEIAPASAEPEPTETDVSTDSGDQGEPAVETAVEPVAESVVAAAEPAVVADAPAEAGFTLEPEQADKPARSHWGEPVSSAPVLERVVMSPKTDEADGKDGEQSDKPVRKGWWQRRFGS